MPGHPTGPTVIGRLAFRDGSGSTIGDGAAHFSVKQNTGRIPHAHVVVNNTNVRTMLRLQDSEPRALKRSVQRLAKEIGALVPGGRPQGR